MGILTTTRYWAIYDELNGTTTDLDNPSVPVNQYTNIISAVNKRIEIICGRDFDGISGNPSVSYTEYVDGSGTAFIIVNNYPISSLNSIEYVDTDDDVLDTVDVDDCTYYDDGMIKYNGGFYEGKRNIKVVYETSSSIDSNLELIAYRYVGYLLNKFDLNEAKQSESLGDYSYSLSASNDFVSSLTKDLAPYIRYV